VIKVCMIGTGYVGLVSGACLADFGNAVHCVDIDQNRIELLRSGGIPIYEPGLKELVSRNVDSLRLRFTTDVAEGVEGRTWCSSRSAPRRDPTVPPISRTFSTSPRESRST